MPQTLFVKDKGSFTFVKTFVTNAGIHIGKTPEGAFMHIGGQPVKTKNEHRAVIPDGPDLIEALEWFDNRGKPKAEEKPKRKIIAQGNDFTFEDGPITGTQEIIANSSPGMIQDMILAWWGGKMKEIEKAKRRDQTRTGRAVDQIRKEMEEKTEQESSL